MKTLTTIMFSFAAASAMASWTALSTPLSDYGISFVSDPRVLLDAPRTFIENGQLVYIGAENVTSLPRTAESVAVTTIYGENITPAYELSAYGMHGWMFSMWRKSGTSPNRARFTVQVVSKLESRIVAETASTLNPFTAAASASYLGNSVSVSRTTSVAPPGITLTDTDTSRDREIVLDTYFRDNDPNSYVFGRWTVDPTYEGDAGYYAAVSLGSMPHHQDWAFFDASYAQLYANTGVDSTFKSIVTLEDVKTRQNLFDSTDPNDAVITVTNAGEGVSDNRAPLAYFVDPTSREVKYVVLGKRDGTSLKFYTNWPEEELDMFLWDKTMLVQDLGAVTLGDGNKTVTGQYSTYLDFYPDNEYNILDYFVFSEAYFDEDYTMPEWIAQDLDGTVPADADMNGDGYVDLLDYFEYSDADGSGMSVGDTPNFKI